jgi:hypothetical protein
MRGIDRARVDQARTRRGDIDAGVNFSHRHPARQVDDGIDGRDAARRTRRMSNRRSARRKDGYFLLTKRCQ